jgi:PAS domain S-box-containing protein
MQIELNTLNSLFDFYNKFSSDFFCILDDNYNIIKSNSSFDTTLQYTGTELLGVSLFIYSLDKDVEMMKQNLKNSHSNVQEFKSHLFTKDKNFIPVLWSSKFDDTTNRYILIGKKLNILEEKVSSRLKTISNAISDGFFILNKNWEVTYFNKSAVLSVKHNDFKLDAKEGFWQMFPKAVNTQFFTQFSKAFKDQIPVSFEEYSPTLNKWFKIDAVPYGDELNVISKDISPQIIEEKTNNLELKVFEMKVENKYSLEELLNFLLVGIENLHPNMFSSILKVDNNRVYHLASPRLPQAYTKLLNGTLIGPKAGSCGTAAFFRKQIIVDDINTNPLWDNYRDAVSPYGFNSCWSSPIISNKDQSVMATYAVYYKDKKIPSVDELKNISKITQTIKVLLEDVKYNEALILSNNRYAMVSMATNDAIYDWDLANNKTYWNDNIYELFGYTISEISHETNWWEHRVHPDDRAKVLSSSRTAIKERKSIWTAEYRFECKNKSYKYVSDRSFIIYNKTGNAITIIGAIHDINDLKEKEIFVSQQNAKLKEIAQTSSHDLRGPVTSILGLINLFNKDHAEDPFNKEVIIYLEHAAKQLDDVIHTIVTKTLEADHTIYFKNKALAFKADDLKEV